MASSIPVVCMWRGGKHGQSYRQEEKEGVGSDGKHTHPFKRCTLARSPENPNGPATLTCNHADWVCAHTKFAMLSYHSAAQYQPYPQLYVASMLFRTIQAYTQKEGDQVQPPPPPPMHMVHFIIPFQSLSYSLATSMPESHFPPQSMAHDVLIAASVSLQVCMATGLQLCTASHNKRGGGAGADQQELL
jgi:hypothetical protein